MENKTTDSKKEIKISELSPSEKLGNMLLDSLEAHKSFMRLIRMGGIDTEQIETLEDNNRMLLRVRSLIRVIAIQRELIANARPIVHHFNYTSWNQKYKSEEQKIKNTFENEDNDYNKLLFLLNFLKYAEQNIIMADQTKTLKDDFLIYKFDNNGNKKAILTSNFFEMAEDLEESFERIYSILLRNGLLITMITEQGKKLKSNEIF
jgi:hypothetical protein